MSVGHRIEEDPSITVLLADASEGDVVGGLDAEDGGEFEGLIRHGQRTFDDGRFGGAADGEYFCYVIGAIGGPNVPVEAVLAKRC